MALIPPVNHVQTSDTALFNGLERFYNAIRAITEIVRPIGEPDPWRQPVFLNSWTNFAVGYQIAGYCIDGLGYVHLRGLVKRTVAGFGSGVPLFVLPPKYRPARRLNFGTLGNNNFARVEILVTGEVALVAGVSATPENFVALDGITFDTRA